MLFKPAKVTVKEIAAGVAKSGAFERSEREFKEAVAEHNAAIAETRKAIAINSDQSRGAEVNRCVAIEAAAEKPLRAARENFLPLRAEHGAKVAAALKPAREAAAARILELLADFAPEIGVLTDSMFAIERFGAQCVRLPPLGLDDAEYVARRIAGSAAPAEE